MSNPLEEFLIKQIGLHGPMSIDQFMSVALGHPEYGYYMKQDPLGRGGDFITAPEVSQMFGEMLGAWVADVWVQMGSPEKFTFLECGPGRGTLMADMMRAAKGVPGFHEACAVHLLETSLALKEKQAQSLKDYAPAWHDTLESVPDDVPVICVGNEFLDALPVRQFEKTEDGWCERVIAHEDGAFVFARRAQQENPVLIPERARKKARPGDVCEVGAAAASFMQNLCALLKATSGAALFVDYGHEKSAPGDTLQAVHRHEYCDVLEHIGDADLTAHVDFDVLADICFDSQMNVQGPVEQARFLKALGIVQRAEKLSAAADARQKADIGLALQRLTDADQMGSLFKVMGISYGAGLNPAGF